MSIYTTYIIHQLIHTLTLFFFFRPHFFSVCVFFSTYRHKPTFLNLGQLLCFLLALLSLILSNIYIRHYQDGDPLQVLPFPRFLGTPSTFWEYILRFLLIPGVYEYGIIAYPLIPWISLCFWGMAVGFVFLTHNGKKHLSLFSFLQFLLSLIIFISLRTWGGDVGNFRGWHVDHLENEHWILVYLDVCKYPPSPAYIFMTMAGNSLILCLFTLLLNYFQSLALSRVEEQEHFQYLSDHFSSVSHAQPIDIYTSFSQSSSSSYVAARSGSKRYISNSSMIGETHLINVVTATRPSVGSMAEAEGGEEEVRKTCCSDYSDGFAEFKNWPFLARVIFYPLLIFGRVPLFFYVVHWLWLGIGCLVLHSFSNGLWMGYVSTREWRNVMNVCVSFVLSLTPSIFFLFSFLSS